MRASLNNFFGFSKRKSDSGSHSARVTRAKAQDAAGVDLATEIMQARAKVDEEERLRKIERQKDEDERNKSVASSQAIIDAFERQPVVQDAKNILAKFSEGETVAAVQLCNGMILTSKGLRVHDMGWRLLRKTDHPLNNSVIVPWLKEAEQNWLQHDAVVFVGKMQFYPEPWIA